MRLQADSIPMFGRSRAPGPVRVASVVMFIQWMVFALFGLVGSVLGMFALARSSGGSFEEEAQVITLFFLVTVLVSLLGLRLAWVLPLGGRAAWISALLLEFCLALAVASLLFLLIPGAAGDEAGILAVLSLLLLSALVPLGALSSRSARANFRSPEERPHGHGSPLR